MIPGIVGFPGPLLDDDPFGIAPAAPYLRVDIILSIATAWKASFSVLEIAPSNITWEWHATSFFQLRKEIIGFLWNSCE